MSSDIDGNEIRRVHSHQDLRLAPIREVLDELAAGESGVGFIYSVLELLAGRYELSDAVLVLMNESVGPQIFRLGRKDVSVELATRLGTTPGLYSVPDAVPLDDLESVLHACERALAAPPTSLRVRDYRAIISATLVIVDVATFVMAVANVDGPVRFVLGLIFGIAVPGWSIIGLINFKNAALEVGLTFATSLSLIMIFAQIMMTVSLWHPVSLEEILCLICLPSLVWQARPLNRLTGVPR